METANINNKLGITYPQSFEPVPIDELKQRFGMGYDHMWGISDPEHHMFIAVIWKESNELLGKLVGTAPLAKRAEKAMSKAYRNNDYHCDGFFQRELGGHEAVGFAYGNAFDGVEQSCQTIVVKDGTCCYTLYYYTRTSVAEANAPTFEDILASVTFA